MTVRLTAARSEDAAGIAQLSRDLIEAGLGWSWRRGRVLRAMSRDDHLVVVALDRSKLVGFGIMQYLVDRAHLVLLAVAPQYQRRGIGAKMVRWLEQCALTGGIWRVTLELRAGNRGAQRFYRALGYRVERRLVGYYRGREAALRMYRRIGSADRANNEAAVASVLARLLGDGDDGRRPQ